MKYFYIISFLYFFIFCIEFIHCNDPEIKNNGLYKSTDNIIIVKGDVTYNNTVINSNTVLIIEYYNSWCGHCVRFVPTWKLLANDIKGNKSIHDKQNTIIYYNMKMNLIYGSRIKYDPVIMLYYILYDITSYYSI